jgi:hypothetical protein
MLQRESLEQALAGLGALLASRGQRFELVAVGGSSLMLLGLLRRPTRDLDIVALVESGHYVKATALPEELKEAVQDIGEALGIGPTWLNEGPASLLDFGLPENFAKRVETRRYGSLTLHIAGRQDQVYFKLYAAVDHGPTSKHFQDLLGLAPTRQELISAARWTLTHDPSEGFRGELLAALADLGVADGEREL